MLIRSGARRGDIRVDSPPAGLDLLRAEHPADADDAIPPEIGDIRFGDFAPGPERRGICVNVRHDDASGWGKLGTG